MTEEPAFELFGQAAVVRKAEQRRALARALGAVVVDDDKQRTEDEDEQPDEPAL
jgi:hypothetical protein